MTDNPTPPAYRALSRDEIGSDGAHQGRTRVFRYPMTRIGEPSRPVFDGPEEYPDPTSRSKRLTDKPPKSALDFPADFAAAARSLMTGKMADSVWIMSFCDADRPEGTQWLGSSIVPGDTFEEALTRSHLIGCNPGGECQALGPIPIEAVKESHLDRLLTRVELDDAEATKH